MTKNWVKIKVDEDTREVYIEGKRPDIDTEVKILMALDNYKKNRIRNAGLL